MDNNLASLSAQLGGAQGTWYPPGWPLQYPNVYSCLTTPEMAIRAVSNGFVLTKHNCEYVFTSVEQMTSWLNKELEEKK